MATIRPLTNQWCTHPSFRFVLNMESSSWNREWGYRTKKNYQVQVRLQSYCSKLRNVLTNPWTLNRYHHFSDDVPSLVVRVSDRVGNTFHRPFLRAVDLGSCDSCERLSLDVFFFFFLNWGWGGVWCVGGVVVSSFVGSALLCSSFLLILEYWNTGILYMCVFSREFCDFFCKADLWVVVDLTCKV